ncbi:MAG: D-erythronate dehydrogenase [Hyphomicrobiales bacterium]
MKILIIGGAGMVGQKLAALLINAGLSDQSIREVILYDVVPAQKPDAPFPITLMQGSIDSSVEASKLADLAPDIIFHLAAIVSGEAEKNFTKGWDINARGSWWLLEALRAKHEASRGDYVPRVIFTSSIAVFGGPFPDKIDDDFLSAPLTSYGAQKAMTELLVSDYSRKGFIDGMSIRLPTICVRPGKPNLAASSFFSGIIREPLNGLEAILPVPSDVRHWHASPKSAAGFLAHAAELDLQRLGGRRALNMPGVSCTVEEQIEALKDVAGADIAKHIRSVPDEAIMSIVENWPRNFAPEKALSLGFTAEHDFKDIIEVYMAEDMPKQNS